MLSLAALGVAILVTVPLKLSNIGSVQQTLSHNLEQTSASMLVQQGFSIESGNRYGVFFINARHDDCRLQVTEAVAKGFNIEAIKATTPQDAQLVFEYHGRLWEAHPTFRATISEIWSRLKWQLGMGGSWSPVVSIAAIGHCSIKSLPWGELATIQAD